MPALVAYAVSNSQADSFAAEAEVVYAQTSGNPTTDDQSMATQVAVMTSRPVLQPVADALDVPVEELLSHVSAERITGSQVIRLTVEAETSDRAVEIADAVITSYRDRLSGSPESEEAERTYLQQRLSELEQQLDVNDATTPDQQLLIGQLVDLQTRLTDLDVPTAPPVELLAAPYALSDPVSPQPVRAAAAGAILGFLCATLFLVLYLRGRTRRSGSLARTSADDA